MLTLFRPTNKEGLLTHLQRYLLDDEPMSSYLVYRVLQQHVTSAFNNDAPLVEFITAPGKRTTEVERPIEAVEPDEDLLDILFEGFNDVDFIENIVVLPIAPKQQGGGADLPLILMELNYELGSDK